MFARSFVAFVFILPVLTAATYLPNNGPATGGHSFGPSTSGNGVGRSSTGGNSVGRPSTGGNGVGRPSNGGNGFGRPNTGGNGGGRAPTGGNGDGRAPTGGNGGGRAPTGGNGLGMTPVPATDPTTINQCNTGSVQCCNSLQTVSSSSIATLLGTIGSVVGGPDSLFGTNCSPIDTLAEGANSCTTQPVCCTNNNFRGLIVLGCNPINL